MPGSRQETAKAIFFFFSIFFSFSFICLLPQMLFNSANPPEAVSDGNEIPADCPYLFRLFENNIGKLSPACLFSDLPVSAQSVRRGGLPLTIIFSSFCALSSILVTYRFFHARLPYSLRADITGDLIDIFDMDHGNGFFAD